MEATRRTLEEMDKAKNLRGQMRVAVVGIMGTMGCLADRVDLIARRLGVEYDFDPDPDEPG